MALTKAEIAEALFDQLGLWSILDQYLGRAKGVPFADRTFVLVANRLIAPTSEHGLAGWLETDFVCDRQTELIAAKNLEYRRLQIRMAKIKIQLSPFVAAAHYRGNETRFAHKKKQINRIVK